MMRTLTVGRLTVYFDTTARWPGRLAAPTATYFTLAPGLRLQWARRATTTRKPRAAVTGDPRGGRRGAAAGVPVCEGRDDGPPAGGYGTQGAAT